MYYKDLAIKELSLRAPIIKCANSSLTALAPSLLLATLIMETKSWESLSAMVKSVTPTLPASVSTFDSNPIVIPKGLNIMFIMATSDVYNDFFKNDFNILSNTLITFDYTNKEEAIYANIDGANNLSIGTFLIKQGKDIIKYHNFEFDDKYIDEIVNK